MREQLFRLYQKMIKPYVPRKAFSLYHHLRRLAYRSVPVALTRGQSNDLVKYFRSNQSNLIHKWDHYFDIYDRHFSRFRGKDVVILEIGIYHGGSLEMWRHYFGEKARIIGVDINPECQKFAGPGIEVFIGSQEDPEFLERLKREIPPVDILIDDGGHTMRQQILTFEHLFGHIRDEGVYLCEDLHTSYWKEYGGGYRHPDSFIEYSKNFIDALHAWHSQDETALSVTDFTRTADSLHFYDSILVIEKAKRTKPVAHMTGKPMLSI